MNIEYIEEKYCPLEIGPGWYSIVQPLFDYVEKYNKDKPKNEQISILQCKEKFGELRFYTAQATSELNSLIKEAEDKSIKTCEQCGKPGFTRSRNRWLCTLCDECAKELGYE